MVGRWLLKQRCSVRSCVSGRPGADNLHNTASVNIEPHSGWAAKRDLSEVLLGEMLFGLNRPERSSTFVL
jgi:hypothetical protein